MRTVYVVCARGLAISTCKTRREAEARIAATSPQKRQYLSIR